MGAFDQNIFKDEDVIVKMLLFLDEGNKTNFILNVLLLSNVTLWKNNYLQELVDKFKNFTEESY